MTTKYRIEDKRDNSRGVATVIGEGRYIVEMAGKEPREIAESTFSRRYLNMGVVVEKSRPAPQAQEKELEVLKELKIDFDTKPGINFEEGDEAEVTPDDTSNSDEPGNLDESETNSTADEVSEVAATDEVSSEEQDTAKDEEQDTAKVGEEKTSELDDLLEGAEVLPDAPAEVLPDVADKADKPNERTLDDIGVSIELIDWKLSPTTGGKTERVTSMVRINEYMMEITEYSGFITDVRLSKENPEVPENDPDAEWILAYKSPKMSLKDTLEWMGLDEDDTKIARREITAIRKAVKSQHMSES